MSTLYLFDIKYPSPSSKKSLCTWRGVMFLHVGAAPVENALQSNLLVLVQHHHGRYALYVLKISPFLYTNLFLKVDEITIMLRIFIILGLFLLYVQEVVTHFIYNLLHKMGHYFLDTQYPGWGDVAKNWRLKIQVWTNTYISISKSDHRHIINIRVGEHFLLCTSHQGYCCCCCNVQSALMAWPLVEELFLRLPLLEPARYPFRNPSQIRIWYHFKAVFIFRSKSQLDLNSEVLKVLDPDSLVSMHNILLIRCTRINLVKNVQLLRNLKFWPLKGVR